MTVLLRALNAYVLALLTLPACADEPSRPLARTTERIVYGEDDRVEAMHASGVAAEVVTSSAALIAASRLVPDGDGFVVSAPTLAQRFGVCTDERFVTQPTAASCSAVVLGPDLVLTAGHCVDAAGCADVRVTFGYAVDASEQVPRLAADAVFECAEVVVRHYTSEVDFAVLRLDRPVGSRTPRVRVGPLPLARGDELVVAGHPSGLPTKAMGGAQVLDARANTRDFFLSDLDSFPGSSGSGVFLASTGELAGIIARGPNPGYQVDDQAGCARPLQATSESALIEAVYVHHALEAFCRVAHDPVLCACGDGVCRPAEGETSASCATDCGSLCGDGECNGTEDGNDCYQDCGACGNATCETSEATALSCVADCGCPPGTARLGRSCAAVVGNLNGDDRIDSKDVHAFTELSAQPDYARVADVDCDGVVGQRDLRALRDHARGRLPHLPCDAVESVSLGAQHACALLGGGRVRCWGSNGAGQLGLGDTRTRGDDESWLESDLVSVGAPATQLVAGPSHTCALLHGGRVRCWGDGASGKLGLGTTQSLGDDELVNDVPPVALSRPAQSIAAGGDHTCALLDDGTVQCWGSNVFGQLGTASASDVGDDEPPNALPPIRFAERIVAIAAGFDHSCALDSRGDVRCWGGNFFGQLGAGDPLAGGPGVDATASAVVGVGGAVRSIQASLMTTCAERIDGASLCWGQNFSGELGYPATFVIGDDESPSDVGPVPVGEGLRQLVLGPGRSCGLYQNGEARCWGQNFSGELGYGNDLPLPLGTIPGALPALELGAAPVQLALGARHSCAVDATRSLRCWGANESGELGQGHTTPLSTHSAPATIGGLPMTVRSDPAWHFVDDQRVTPWVKRRRLGSRAVQQEIVIENAGTDIVRDFRLLWNIATAEAQGGEPRAGDTALRRSTLRWRQEDAALYNLELDFTGTTLRPDKRTGPFGERMRLYFSNDAPFRTSNDYGGADVTPSDCWQRSSRVQLVDATGAIIYGWSR